MSNSSEPKSNQRARIDKEYTNHQLSRVGVRSPGNITVVEWLVSLYADSSAGRVLGYIPGKNWEKMKSPAVSFSVRQRSQKNLVAYDGSVMTQE